VKIEVVYAGVSEQAVVELDLPEGSNAGDAVRESGLARRFSEIDTDKLLLGVYGERVTPEHMLEEGDRVEIYRTLIADPKEARRRRARRRP
jgi:putative ubiquitin-RnfH superfamily antitoxin RatB of RatAB toxin-antitoxin module